MWMPRPSATPRLLMSPMRLPWARVCWEMKTKSGPGGMAPRMWMPVIRMKPCQKVMGDSLLGMERRRLVANSLLKHGWFTKIRCRRAADAPLWVCFQAAFVCRIRQPENRFALCRKHCLQFAICFPLHNSVSLGILPISKTTKAA